MRIGCDYIRNNKRGESRWSHDFDALRPQCRVSRGKSIHHHLASPRLDTNPAGRTKVTAPSPEPQFEGGVRGFCLVPISLTPGAPIHCAQPQSRYCATVCLAIVDGRRWKCVHNYRLVSLISDSRFSISSSSRSIIVEHSITTD